MWDYLADFLLIIIVIIIIIIIIISGLCNYIFDQSPIFINSFLLVIKKFELLFNCEHNFAGYEPA
jgi:TRAP-type C4-dicarboxylate transport system permease small subunit